MTIVISTDIICDGDDCWQWKRGTTGPRANSKEARQEARRLGWKVTARRDLCPACARIEEGR